MSVPQPPILPTLPELPSAPILPRPPWEQMPTLAPPGLSAGVVTAPGKGWCLVEYADISTRQKIRFTSNPVVVALAEVRFGDILPVDAPKITVPSITLPALSSMPSIALPKPISIPRIVRHDFNSAEYCELVAEKARDAAKNLGPPWPLDIVWDWFCDEFVYTAFYTAYFGIGFILNILWDSFIQPQIDKVEDAIDAGLKDIHDATQNAVNAIGDQIDSVLADFKGKTQTAINAFGTEIQTRVNQGLSAVIPMLYTMMGFAPGQLLTIVNTRNVTTTSFQYYALSKGQKTHYLAVGIP